MSKRKREIKTTGILFNIFSIGTKRPVTFLNALERLCNKYAVKISKKRKDWEMQYEFTD